MNEKANSVFKTVPAASALHRVPQFDPLKLLRKTTSAKTGEKVLKLDLRYKKTWFRLAYPRGRMFTNPLRITDQMAIFEAQLFADRDDPTVLAQFTSCHTRSESGPQYIRNAQDEALNEALDNAGFGIQLSDLVESSDNGYGSEILLSQVEALLRQPDDTVAKEPPAPVEPVRAISTPPVQAAKSDPSVAVQTAPPAPVQTAPPAPVQTAPPVPAQMEAPAPAQEGTKPSVQPVTDAPVSQTAPIETARAPQTASVPETSAPFHGTAPVARAISGPAAPQPGGPVSSAAAETANILQLLGGIPAAAVPGTEPSVTPTQTERPAVLDRPKTARSVQAADAAQPDVADTTAAAAEPEAVAIGMQPSGGADAGAAVTYTEDMSVDEIRELMTIAQAKELVVGFGPNKGWTLGQVAERRRSSLKFYALVSTEASNALKAGSFLLLDEVSRARAG